MSVGAILKNFKWKFDKFNFGKLLELDCPPYLEEKPEIQEFLEKELEDEEFEREPLDRILDFFRNRNKKGGVEFNSKEDSHHKQRNEANHNQENSIRIKKQNEEIRKKRVRDQKKAERKKKRQKKWQDIFGNKNWSKKRLLN